MKEKQTNVKFLDSVFLCFCSICFSIIIVGNLKTKLITQLIIGTILGILFFVFIFQKTRPLFFMTEEKRSAIKKQNATIKALSTLSQSEIYKFFTEMLKPGYKVAVKNNIIKAESKASPTCTFFMYINFLEPQITATEIAAANAASKTAPLLILGNSYSESAQTFSENRDFVHLLTPSDTFNLLCSFNCFPPIKEPSLDNKLKSYISSILSPEHTKGFIKASLLTLALSFFTTLRLYYRVFAALFFILGIFCFLKASPKEPTTKFSLAQLNKKSEDN